MDSRNERVVWLIDQFHGHRGVNRAAQHTGVPQSTLQRIYTGDRRPSLEVLQRIANAYAAAGVTLEWLAEGKGAAPRVEVELGGERVTDSETVLPFVAFKNAKRVVGVTEGSLLEKALEGVYLPIFDVAADAARARRSKGKKRVSAEPIAEAVADVLKGWSQALRGLTAAYGAERVADGLSRAIPVLACQDDGFLQWLEQQGRLRRDQLLTWFGEFQEWRDAQSSGDAGAKVPQVKQPPKSVTRPGDSVRGDAQRRRRAAS